ncbi:MAG: SH3 domain-containing protein [Azovibrio sp.]|uniref:SH3 domain-containing protein n=1 Tax=Azovibrio sp. TaxID=1872673 RepID=UPI003C72F012
MKSPRLTLLLLAAGLGTAAWAENATLTRASDLKAKPFTDAATVTRLQEQSQVTIISNDGGWTRIRTSSGQTGWVRLLYVRPNRQDDTVVGIGKSLGTLGNVVRTGSTGNTVTTGAKGISKDDLEHAAPNFQEVKRMDQYKVSTGEAERFARNNRLKAQEISYLDSTDGQRN